MHGWFNGDLPTKHGHFPWHSMAIHCHFGYSWLQGTKAVTPSVNRSPVLPQHWPSLFQHQRKYAPVVRGLSQRENVENQSHPLSKFELRVDISDISGPQKFACLHAKHDQFSAVLTAHLWSCLEHAYFSVAIHDNCRMPSGTFEANMLYSNPRDY